MNDGFFHFQLREYQAGRALVSLFVDPDNPDDFIAGYISHVNPRQVVLNAVSPAGRYDSVIGVRLTEISSILGEDDYSERLRRLLALRGERITSFIEPAEGEDLFHAMCRTVMEEERVMTIWCGDNEYVGFVTALDDMRVTLSALDFFGQDPVETPILLRDITMASFGAEDDEIYQILSDNRLPD